MYAAALCHIHTGAINRLFLFCEQDVERFRRLIKCVWSSCCYLSHFCFLIIRHNDNNDVKQWAMQKITSSCINSSSSSRTYTEMSCRTQLRTDSREQTCCRDKCRLFLVWELLNKCDGMKECVFVWNRVSDGGGDMKVWQSVPFLRQKPLLSAPVSIFLPDPDTTC